MKKILLATLAIAGLTLSSGAVLAQSLTDDLSFDGVDADGDGNVTWQDSCWSIPTFPKPISWSPTSMATVRCRSPNSIP
mgnify:CR=1 FL=1